VRGIPAKPEAKAELKKAHRLAWVTLLYNCSAIGMLFLVMGGSQALKTELVGELLSFIPPVLFLVGDRFSRKQPNDRFPFGYERAVSAGYVGAAVALLGVGSWLLFDGALKLVAKDHPTIGGFPLFGHVIWIGWLAFGVLLWSAIPAFLLARAKRTAAEVLHDKTLAADAEINAADWQSASAAMIGLAGVGLGYWWTDSVAAVLISAEIVRSGWSELKTALGDIADRRPKDIMSKEDEPLPEMLTAHLQQQRWVKDVVVLLRERGREFTAEAYVVPADEDGLVERLTKASDDPRQIDPRLAALTIAPVRHVPEDVAKARLNPA
jgi:divalent metal cation (Fe/Co/Zn/Cd) transporter